MTDQKKFKNHKILMDCIIIENLKEFMFDLTYPWYDPQGE